MTLDDLLEEFRNHSTTRAGIAAVVRAIRDVIDQAYSEGRASKVRGDNENVQRQWVDALINEILGDAGAEKVAGVAALEAAGAGLSPASGQAPATDFAAHLARQRAFSERTFGPGERVEGVSDHIRKELVEVAKSEPGHDRQREWIDVVMLALDGAWRSGMSPEEIIAGLRFKLDINERRSWPDWRTADPNKAIEHHPNDRAPAPAPCLWRVHHETRNGPLYVSQCDGEWRHATADPKCPSCGKEIFFPTAPAPAVCEWLWREHRFEMDKDLWLSGCGQALLCERHKPPTHCPECKAPIKFTEAKT